MTYIKSVISLGWGLAAAAAFAQAPAQPPPAQPHPPGTIGAPEGTGPWPAVAQVEAALPSHTIYRPAKLPRRAMPILLWGNGGCRDNGLGNARFLRKVSSHGYLIVAAGRARSIEPMRQPEAANAPPVTPAGRPGGAGPARIADETWARQLIEGLDWALAENKRRGSPYYRRLDPNAVAAMGHSCGGLQAISVAADPRVKTAMIWNSGVYNRGPGAGRSGIAVTKEQLRDIKGPIAYVTGGPSDIAHQNALDDFRRIDHVPALFAWQPVGHGGTFYTAPNGGAYAKLAVAWLGWQLKGDRAAARMFRGPRCGLCVDPSWTVIGKRLG